MLVQYVLDGDREAFAALLRHWPGVMRLCTRLLGPIDGQDIAQEAALQAFLSIGEQKQITAALAELRAEKS